MTTQEQTSAVPPYVPYRTFQTFLEFLQEDEIPDRIDRTVWRSRFSGSSGTQLTTALKVLGLIDPDGRPTPELRVLVNGEGEDRRTTLKAVLERFYLPVFELELATASKGQFREAFHTLGAREGVVTKSEAFFIRAADAAGIKLSKRITAGRHGAGKSRVSAPASRPRTQPVPAPAQETVAPPSPTEPPQQGSSLKLELADRILAKYPDFDPAWEPAVQAKWLEGMTRLYEGLSVAPPEREDPQGDEPGV